ncbi:MAG: hypothetical protein ACP5OU_02575 [Methanothrix sp.]
MASVAHGRQVADIEALRIARRYEKNDLLKGLPVPRLRISQVNISLPMILSEVIPGIPAEENDPGEISRKTVDGLREALSEEIQHLQYQEKLKSITDIRRKSIKSGYSILERMKKEDALEDFSKVFKAKLKRAFLDLELAEGKNTISDASIRYSVSEAAESALLDVIKERFFIYAMDRVREQERPESEKKNRKVGEEGDVQEKIEDGIPQSFDSDRARNSTRDILQEDYIKNLIKDVRRSAESASLISKTKAPDIYIAVDTDSIKNAGGGPDAVTRLNLVLREEGLEWLTEMKDGKEIKKLMPE